MIKNRQDLKLFLQADAKSMDIQYSSKYAMLKAYFTNPRWRFIKKLRKVEYYKNTATNPVKKIIYFILWIDYKKYGLKLGFTIPPNVINKGLSLPHYGTIVISKNAQIGENARIHVCVNIGASDTGAPIIGNNVYIGPGVKMFGAIQIGNSVKIGANAVVNKSFLEDNIVLAGIPAIIVKRSISNTSLSIISHN